MELSASASSCFNQHRDVFENGVPPITNGMLSFENNEVNYPGLTTTQLALSSSSAEMDALACHNCIEAQHEQRNVNSPAQEISNLSREQIEETHNQILSTQVEELNASVFLSGEQISSADFHENVGGCYKDIRRNEDVRSGEYEGQGFEEEEIKAESSSCNYKGSPNGCNSVGQDTFGSGLNREMFDPGVCPVQEAAVQSNVTSMENSDSGPTDKLARPHLRDATVNYVLARVKLLALLMESLLQLLSIVKNWASQTLVKPKAIPTLAEKRVDKNEAEIFSSEGSSIIEPQNGRENVYAENLVGALGFPLGMSMATVLAEILAFNYCLKENISAEEISELLGLAMRESLHKVLGCQCNRLVRDFEAAFTSTFKTITRVKQAHYGKKMASYPSEKKMSISDGQMPGLATVGYANDTRAEYADALERRVGKFREKTDCKRLIEQTSGSLGPVQGSGMKGGVQQFCKPISTKSDVQITSNPKDELPKENCRVDCQECSCITESVDFKDRNNLTCQTSQLAGNASLSSFANNEIEEISQKMKNIKFESADCKDFAVGNNPSVATEKMTPTDRNFEENDSDLASAIYESGKPSSMLGANLNQQVILHEKFERQLANTASSTLRHPEWTNSISNVFEKSLMEQERCNNLREVEIGLTMRRLHLKEAKMFVDTESNRLTRQSISMSQSKASFKESKFIDKKLNKAYVDLNRTCADHLVAGLMLMLFALAYGSWKYSYANLSQAVEACHANSKEPGKSSWFPNPMDSVTGHIKTLVCEVTVIGRILFGLAVIGLLATSLLRRTVSSSSQAMPTSIILIVLGLICGYAGKLSVDSLGGSGFHWLVQWEFFCLLHAFSACFPASLLRVLNGPPSAHEEVKEKLHLILFSLRKFIFHALLMVLPVMAGLTPFASVREWTNHFSHIIFDNVLEPVRISVRDSIEQFLVV